MTLSGVQIAQKNKLNNDAAFILLAKIVFTGNTIYLANNSDDVTWNGHTWNRTAFSIDSIDITARGEIPIFNAEIQNVDRALIPYLDESSGAQGTSVIFYVVDSINLSETTPYLEVETFVVGCSETVDSITFKLGRKNPMMQVYPVYRFMKGYCRYRLFKGPLCGYTGTLYTDCGRTYSECEARGNVVRFGGFPSIGRGGIHVA